MLFFIFSQGICFDFDVRFQTFLMERAAVGGVVIGCGNPESGPFPGIDLLQAFQMAFLTLLPSILLSGFVFPFDGMPKPAQWIAQVLPLTHFVEMIRGIVLRGAPLADLGTQAAKLAVFLAVTLAIATRRFRKRLD